MGVGPNCLKNHVCLLTNVCVKLLGLYLPVYYVLLYAGLSRSQ